MFTLPTHPRTGLSAIGWRRNGSPIWPVAGAAPDDDQDDQQGDDSGADDTEGGDDGGDDEGADQLGDAGKKALDRMKQQLRDERRRRKAAEEKASEAGKPKPEGGPDLDEVRKQAREEATAEALKDRVLDKIEAKARKFADSEDAAAILLRSRQVEDFIDGGKVDTDAIAEALDELAEAKPHLLARQGSSGGNFDSGRGKRSEKGQLSRDDLKGMTPAQIEAARKAGRLDRVMGKTK